MDNNLQSVLDETLDLIADLKEYIETTKKVGTGRMATTEDMSISDELSRLTVKLTSSISWLFLYKAVINNEISIETLIEEGNLLVKELDRQKTTKKQLDEFPEDFKDLCSQAENLYIQIKDMHNELLKNNIN